MKRMLVALVALCAAASFGLAAEVQQPILGDVAGVTVQDDAALEAVRGDGVIHLLVYAVRNDIQRGDVMAWIKAGHSDIDLSEMSVRELLQVVRAHVELLQWLQTMLAK